MLAARSPERQPTGGEKDRAGPAYRQYVIALPWNAAGRGHLLPMRVMSRNCPPVAITSQGRGWLMK